MAAPPVFPLERSKAQWISGLTAQLTSGRVQSTSLPILRHGKTFLNAACAVLFFIQHLGLISSYKQKQKCNNLKETYLTTDNIWQAIMFSVKKDHFNGLHAH